MSPRPEGTTLGRFGDVGDYKPRADRPNDNQGLETGRFSVGGSLADHLSYADFAGLMRTRERNSFRSRPRRALLAGQASAFRPGVGLKYGVWNWFFGHKSDKSRLRHIVSPMCSRPFRDSGLPCPFLTLETMVERSLFRPGSIYTYSYLQVCGRLPTTGKYVQGGTTTGWDHGLSEKDEVV